MGATDPLVLQHIASKKLKLKHKLIQLSFSKVQVGYHDLAVDTIATQLWSCRIRMRSKVVRCHASPKIPLSCMHGMYTISTSVVRILRQRSVACYCHNF